MRLCLKHLRQKSHNDIFEALQQKSRIKLEDELLTELFRVIVQKGDFEAAETIMQRASATNAFFEYIADRPYTPKWKRIFFADDAAKPSMRGGHQMCIDTESRIIYLIGGWDGTKDLADFWKYEIDHQRWTCLSEDLRK